MPGVSIVEKGGPKKSENNGVLAKEE